MPPARTIDNSRMFGPFGSSSRRDEGFSGHMVAVLRALVAPDPGPIPERVDSPVRAVGRRLPGLSRECVRGILFELESLGLVDIPYVRGMVRPVETARPSQWLTEKGWSVLRTLNVEAV